MTDALEYDVFISYARKDNLGGWVTALRDAVYDDFRDFTSEQFRIFFDESEIHGLSDWELRLRQGLRSSRVLLVCLSPNYFASPYCRWEWDEFARFQARRVGGGDAVAGVYFTDLGGDHAHDDIANWRREVERVQFEKLQPWFDDGVAALRDAQVRDRLKALGAGVYRHLRQARLAKQAPGNLRRHNPGFVGRVTELRKLREQLSGGHVGVVTAVHGIGGMGKTELAVTYAHAYGHVYQGGTWQVDADGASSMLEAVSMLATSSDLGLSPTEDELRDRAALGSRVLARLETSTIEARERDEATGACLLLLDNVSDPALLSAAELAGLPSHSWFHVVATTRLGRSDIRGEGSAASVAMVEVGSLDPDDALTLVRDHQPARDAARLIHEFSSQEEADAAREIVTWLNGYALAVEQAAVCLGTSGMEPSALLEFLRAEGTQVLDDVGESQAGQQEILHQGRLVGAIVDQTVGDLPGRARAALAFASCLPPEGIPWRWLEDLAVPTAVTGRRRLPGMGLDDDWLSTRRVLEGRRLLTDADDPRAARLHRVIGAHLRDRLTDEGTRERLDEYLIQVAERVVDADVPDLIELSAIAVSVRLRLAEGADAFAYTGMSLVPRARARLGSMAANDLAVNVLRSYERWVRLDPRFRSGLAAVLEQLGEISSERDQLEVALDYLGRALAINEDLASAEVAPAAAFDAVARVLQRLGDVHTRRDDAAGARDACARSLTVLERLASTHPESDVRQEQLARGLSMMGRILDAEGDSEAAERLYLRALALVKQPPRVPRRDAHRRQTLMDVVGRIVGIRSARGDVDGALDMQRAVVSIAEELAAADTTDWSHRYNLAYALSRFANLLDGGGQSDAAVDSYGRALAIYESAATADPSNGRVRRALGAAQGDLARALAETGDDAAATDMYLGAVETFSSLVEAAPEVLSHQRDLAFVLTALAEWHADRGRSAQAMQAYRRALAVRQDIAARNPDGADLWEYVESLDAVANLLSASGESAEELPYRRQAVLVLEALVSAAPENFTYAYGCALGSNRVAVLLAESGDLAGAVEHWRRSTALLEQLTAAHPESVGCRRQMLLQAAMAGGALDEASDPSALDFWQMARAAGRALQSAGDMTPTDEQFVAFVEQRLGTE